MSLFSQPVDAIASHQVLCFTAIAVGCIVVARLTRRKSRFPLPPGPKALPVIGNLLDVPQTSAWKTFSEWSGKWGQYGFGVDVTSILQH